MNMMMNGLNNHGELARVFLKNGQQRMGILLQDTTAPDCFDQGVHLLSHERVGTYLEQPDASLVDVYPPELVDAIDIYLK